MSLREIYPHLCQPFPLKALEIKPGATTRDKTRALAMPYADIRVYQQCLDDIVGPEDWQVSYRPWGEAAVICQLTLLGVAREDIGEVGEDGDNKFTSAVARAFKRACSCFGLGRYIYGLPTVWAEYDADRRVFKDVKGTLEQIYRQAGILLSSASDRSR
ncbi:MAG: hypothetical protein NW237_00945 [Cyanobacteriota bacterium]|nr:hypothetical protein [Cyanobacteriota bacterium]